MNALNINHKNRLFMVFENKLQGTVQIRPNAHKEGQLNLYKSITILTITIYPFWHTSPTRNKHSSPVIIVIIINIPCEIEHVVSVN